MSFVNEYAHWMHLSTTLTTGYIEFHPLTAVWNPSEVNWRLEFPNDLSRGVMMGDNGASMLDRRSKTFQMISRHLEPLDAPDHLHVMLDAAGTLTAHLARYNMSFFVNGHKELECLTIRDMVVDSNQSCGAMFGLQNQLLLRGKSLRNTRIRAPGSRCCIIPFGKAEVSNTRVTVSRRGGVQKYFVYQLDTTLGQLNGTTFLSDIYKIYLHACTSYPLPDDLTGRTGIEEALYEVDSARFLSFLELGTEDAAVLRYIADLTPNLQWYPSHHHRTMQISHWKDFGFLSQHPALVSRVKVIFRYHQQLSSMGMGIVHDTSAATTETDSHLLARLDSRTTGLYASGRQSAPHYSDMVYSGRQPCRASDDTIKLTADVSAYVHSIATIDSLHTITNLWDELQLIQRLHNDEIHSYAEFICPNLSLLFLPLYKAIQRGQQSESFISKLAIILAIMVYTSDNPRVKKLVPTFITFARFPEFRTISPPSANYYDLTLGVSPDFQVITKCLMQFKLPPPTDLPIRRDTENDFEYDQRHDKYWASALGEQVDGFVRILIQQWPCKTPSIPLDQQARAKFYLLDLPSPDLESEINQLFVAWFDNKQLQEFVNELQPILDRVHLSHDPSIPRTVELYKVPPSICAESLQAIVEQFSQSSQVLQRVYGSALVGSLKSYLDRRIQDQRPQRFRTMSNFLLENDYEIRRREFWNFHQLLEITLHPKTPLEVAEFLAGQRPIPTVRTLLTSILSKDSAQTTVPHTWQSAGKMLAQRLVRLQRARRVILFQASGRWEDLSKELDNADFESTISFTNSEWLLIQIASDFTVRSVQNHVAQEMISPRSERNSLTQLNMGEGKSAVIVPLVSSSLSDGKKLVRVVTLKSLAKQMFNLLVHRLSGLANRRIFYLPFSRDFTANPSNLNQLHSLYETCVNEKGILLVQPEHILSFRLMGIDLATGSHGNAGKILLESHRWLMSVSRDILDESDEILRANYQLVYTSGIQQPMDGHPDRWTIIQEVIGYAQKHAVILRPTYESGLDVQRTGEIGCPIVRILSDDAGEALIDSVVSEVLSNDRLKLMPSHLCLAASDFITCRRSSATAFKRLKSFLQESSTWKYLLLYRGLLGRGLLQFVLREKRWRVDYGLDTSRTLLAVPYRAKDLPSLRSDFGHPDVALLLTCLSYYNGGLTESQLDKCFELLFKLDDPPLVYNQWVSGRGAEIPHLFRDLKGINLDDAHQRKTVLGPLFLKNKAVIDFYLSKVVFPRYAKEFPKRLATSSWDLAEIKTHVTTGFSGTNDNRYLLPTSIEQDDATTVGENDAFGQHATNAKVLDILLQAENDNYFCLQPEGSRDNESPTGSDYLHLLVKQNPPVRVLLDVGAQMLDMQSDDLASKWLSLVPEIQAVVFFDKRDELVVMSRGNHIEKFEVSEYNRKLDNCAIYLDDAHTRGTDLKLPIYFRAVVTLGPKLTKDRLVQGCMRMRQLGRGQTVVYFAPMEVDRNIRVCPLFPLDNSAKITASDILRWAMWQSCEYIRHYIPHWAQQGIEYKHRNDAWTLHENGRSAPEPNALETLRASWEQLDARTLDEMYEAQPDAKVTPVHAAYEMPHLKERLDRLGISSLEDPRTDEEQERQVAQEAEQEHQRELPPKLEPAVSTLHKDVALLVTSGIFNSSSSTSPFIPLFSPLGTIHQWSTALFSTKDFARTIKGEDLAVGDFLRPVNWIISVPGRRVLIVLSPFEVNELLTRIQNSKHIHLHLYSPRVNRNMKTTEDLRFYSIPMLPAIDSPLTPDPLGFIPAPMLQLNLWAGQLYLKDLETYQQLCRVLGLVGAEYGSPLWDSDGFIKPEHRVGPMKEECQMLISPVKFLKDVLSLRRKGMGFEPTHMGRVLSAKLLDITHFC
ncbi:hypothetical protein H0H92_007885 [Tricholoma furcatifolium]|nr:hypothetical protein H0H92_007885 [Tricholoma furcatifolium]